VSLPAAKKPDMTTKVPPFQKGIADEEDSLVSRGNHGAQPEHLFINASMMAASAPREVPREKLTPAVPRVRRPSRQSFRSSLRSPMGFIAGY